MSSSSPRRGCSHWPKVRQGDPPSPCRPTVHLRPRDSHRQTRFGERRRVDRGLARVVNQDDLPQAPQFGRQSLQHNVRVNGGHCVRGQGPRFGVPDALTSWNRSLCSPLPAWAAAHGFVIVSATRAIDTRAAFHAVCSEPARRQDEGSVARRPDGVGPGSLGQVASADPQVGYHNVAQATTGSSIANECKPSDLPVTRSSISCLWCWSKSRIWPRCRSRRSGGSELVFADW